MSQITKRALASALKELLEHKPLNKTVSYTHLTLPTIRLV